MHKKKWKLDASKSEILQTGTPPNSRHHCNFTEVNIDGSAVTLSETVIGLRVIFDENISMIQQITETKRKAIRNLQNISCISRYIDISSKMKLVLGLVLSQIDFCNSLCCGLPIEKVRYGLEYAHCNTHYWSLRRRYKFWPPCLCEFFF